MNIHFGSTEDNWHNLQSTGSYEWWYFDAVSDSSEWGVNIIFFDGIPMSPYYIKEYLLSRNPMARDHRGFAVSIYYKGKKIYYDFHHTDDEFSAISDSDIDVRILRSGFHHEQGVYQIDIDTRLYNKYQSLVAKFTFRPISKPNTNSKRLTNISHIDSYHTWVLVSPDNEVSGSLQLFEYGEKKDGVSFTGRGYHDHNYGSRHLFDDWNWWYWGRIYIDGLVIVFYYSLSRDTVINEWVRYCSVHTDSTHTIINSPIFTFDDQRLSMYLLSVASKLTIHGTYNDSLFQVEIQSENKLENGPFYMRTEGKVSGIIDSKIVVGSSIIEYFHPQRLRNTFVQTLVKTPMLRYE